MRQALKLHPDSRCSATAQIVVEAARPRPGALILGYVVTGRTGELRLPPVGEPTRGDALWRHTCLEAFVRPSPGAGYYEFNFAPSRQWAAYRFGDYRKDMRVVSEMNAPRVDMKVDAGGCTLHAVLDLDGLPDLAHAAAWQVGLCAVIEEADGRISYWSLAHPPGKADFHHPDRKSVV